TASAFGAAVRDELDALDDEPLIADIAARRAAHRAVAGDRFLTRTVRAWCVAAAARAVRRAAAGRVGAAARRVGAATARVGAAGRRGRADARSRIPAARTWCVATGRT